MVYALEIEILDPVFYSVNPFFHDWVPSTGFGCVHFSRNSGSALR